MGCFNVIGRDISDKAVAVVVMVFDIVVVGGYRDGAVRSLPAPYGFECVQRGL